MPNIKFIKFKFHLFVFEKLQLFLSYISKQSDTNVDNAQEILQQTYKNLGKFTQLNLIKES